jgi:excisionase family DNA binding protein
MAVGGFMSVPEASAQLGVNDSRVRALLAAGQLAGEKLGGRWLVSQESVQMRLRLHQARGRQLRPANAWSALLLASGQRSQLGEQRDRARVLQLLDARGIGDLRSRLRDRASVQQFYAHPGVLPHLADADSLCLSGASAAGPHDLGLVAGEEVDAYVAHHDANTVSERFGLEPRNGGANVVLRVLASGLELPSSGRVAPLAAVAVDLAEQTERRAARIGHQILERLDRERRWRAPA